MSNECCSQRESLRLAVPYQTVDSLKFLFRSAPLVGVEVGPFPLIQVRNNSHISATSESEKPYWTCWRVDGMHGSVPFRHVSISHFGSNKDRLVGSDANTDTASYGQTDHEANQYGSALVKQPNRKPKPCSFIALTYTIHLKLPAIGNAGTSFRYSCRFSRAGYSKYFYAIWLLWLCCCCRHRHRHRLIKRRNVLQNFVQ